MREPTPAEKALENLKRKLTAQAFLDGLLTKAVAYFFRGDLFKRSSGGRFDKQIWQDPRFQAIARLRGKKYQQELQAKLPLKDALLTLDEDIEQSAKDAKLLAGCFIEYVERGDLEQMNDLVKLCRLHEERVIHPDRRQVKGDDARWYYFTALAAHQCLTICRRIHRDLPTKKEIKERAIYMRARHELLASEVPIERRDEEFKNATRRLAKVCPTTRTWTRIFRDLGLRELPSAPTHRR